MSVHIFTVYTAYSGFENVIQCCIESALQKAKKSDIFCHTVKILKIANFYEITGRLEIVDSWLRSSSGSLFRSIDAQIRVKQSANTLKRDISTRSHRGIHMT